MDEVKIILPALRADGIGILAAVSGGADSVALLALLKEAARINPVRLTAAHFEHGIRAEDSLADAAFVRALCEKWEIPLVEGHADVPALAREQGVGIEEAARNTRYAFLRKALAETASDYIALAHHRDDQAETVLMHLLRGSGLQGMTGMKAIDGVLYRPLLGYPKETLVSYLEDLCISWREDRTNGIPDNPRNAIRLNVLPEIEKIYPGARKAIARFAAIAAGENDYMDRETDRFLDRRARALPFGWLVEFERDEVDWERTRVPALRAVHRLTGLGYEAAERSIGLWEYPDGPACISLTGGWRVERGRRGLYLMKGRFSGIGETPLSLKGETRLPGGLGIIRAEDGTGGPVYDDLFCQEMDGRMLRDAVIRTRKNGDVIHPLGAPGTQKLSDYFINRHIDRPLRDLIPLVAKGNEILWAAGIGISEKVRLKEESASIRLRLTGWPLQKYGGKSNA